MRVAIIAIAGVSLMSQTPGKAEPTGAQSPARHGEQTANDSVLTPSSIEKRSDAWTPERMRKAKPMPLPEGPSRLAPKLKSD